VVVILVRHAEREASGSDPGLNAAGKRRALLLASMLAGAGVTAIFTSQARRTQETAAPLAAKLRKASRVIDEDVADAKAQILGGGACVLVVGHSDTVPGFIAALGGPPGLAIGDDEFDNMFVLSAIPPSIASLVRLRYVSA
jgi:broad specificity phosphatase PhoE